MTSYKKIGTAFILGFLLVGASFYASRYTSFALTNAEGPSVLPAPTQRDYIHIKDSDKDGIPDWQNELIQTEPLYLSGASTSYTYPTTLTGQFGIELFKQLLYAYNDGTLKENQDAITIAAQKTLAERAQDELYTEDDIRTVASADTETLRAYGNSIANIALTYPTDIDDELTLFKALLNDSSEKRIQEFEPLIQAYENMTNQMLAVSVPEQYAPEHTYLLNAFNALLHDTKGMQQLKSDPTYALIRYKRYHSDIESMKNALSLIYSRLYLEDNIRWSEDEPARQLVSFSE